MSASQPAFTVVVEILLPGIDRGGAGVSSSYAYDTISEVLGNPVILDWMYVAHPAAVEVSSPYEEGMWY